jgi:hypothetical protein
MAEALQRSQASSNQPDEMTKVSLLWYGDTKSSMMHTSELHPVTGASSSRKRKHITIDPDCTATGSALTPDTLSWIKKANAFTAADKNRQPLTLHGVIPIRPILKRPRYSLDIDLDKVQQKPASAMGETNKCKRLDAMD